MTASDAAFPIFLWHPGGLVLAVACFCAACAGLAWVVVHGVLRLGPTWAPQPPFHGAMIALFALLLSFTAGDAWRRSEAAYGGLLREAQEARALTSLLDALAMAGQQRATEARDSLADYLARSLGEEWAGYNVRSSPAAALALGRLRAAAAQGLVTGGAAGPAWRSVQDRLDGVEQGRTVRLVAGGVFGDMAVWAALGGLYLVAVFATVCVHLDRRRGGGVAVGALAVAASIALSLVAVTEQPYAGWNGVEPDALVALLHQLHP